MIVHSIHDSSNATVCNLLKHEFSKITDIDAVKNYHPDYSTTPGNFFYILEQGRYKKGNYFVIEIDNEFICSAGWNEYSLDNNIALLLSRLYVNEKYRNYQLGGKVLLPIMLEESNNYAKRWITCNEHNKTIYNMFIRLRRAKNSVPSQWPELYKKFKPIGEHDVYHVKQWVGEYDPTL
jgi:hypothetical protein